MSDTRLRATAIAVATVLMVVLVGGLSWASIPDSTTGEITGCYSNANGSLRVIDAEAGAVCSGTETEVVWSQAGPPGPGVAEPQVVTSEVVIPAGARETRIAHCPTGTRLISGGHSLSGLPTATGSATIGTSAPGLAPPFGNNSTDRWTIDVINHGSTSITATAHALCVSTQE